MSDERQIEEVRPKILATGTSNMNMYHSINEGELSNPNVGMTHYKGKLIFMIKSPPFVVCVLFIMSRVKLNFQSVIKLIMMAVMSHIIKFIYLYFLELLVMGAVMLKNV